MALLSSFVAKAGILLQDTAHVRWTSDELVLWGNDGVREIVAIDPPSVQKGSTAVLVDGAAQSLPDEASVLLDVVGNVTVSGAPGKQIKMCDRADLDARFPKWQTEAKKDTILNVMYDPKYRKVYWTYPPAIAGTKIDIVYSYAPTDIAAEDTVPLDVQYHNPLLDYMLFRAFSKESELQTSGARAVAHYQSFTNALTTIISNRTGGSPPKQER